MESADLGSHASWRHHLRLGLPALRSQEAVAPIERQTERVLEQLKLCVETAGSSLEQVLKCNVYCTSVDKFAVVNEIYARYFPKDPPARIFVNVPAWPGPFDIEIDCIAAL
jgi:2-iminobutanoate/2-iminopropanoate deaminase